MANTNKISSLLLLIITISFCFLAAEIGIRFIYDEKVTIHKDERNLTYRYDNLLGWHPIESDKKSYKGSRLIDIEHNSRGFRDNEHVINNNPRIMFLGDSFVWGYDVNKHERFTEKLRTKLPDISIYNLGVSGYGTDQENLLLQQNYNYYQPNVVFLVYCSNNDVSDNTQNIRYGGYYKPYYVFNSKKLELKGVPVPKSENYFFVNHQFLSKSHFVRRLVKEYYKYINPPLIKLKDPTYKIISSINDFSKRSNFKFIVGIQGDNPKLKLFLSNEKISFVELSNPFIYPTHGKHWTPEGHTFVAEKIYDFFMENSTLSKEAIFKANN